MKKESKEVQINPQGSLGILALGSVGIRKWREEVKKAKQSQENKSDQDGEKADK
jgi:hypothetical protein